MSRRPVVPFLAALALLLTAPAAPAVEPPDYDREARIELAEDRFLRIWFWSQFWARYNQNNPDSLVRGQPADDTLDVGLRRTRLALFAQVAPRIRALLHLGINNQGTVNGGIAPGTGLKPQLFVHEAEGEYELLEDDVLWVGAGLHFWAGPMRFSSASTATILGVDLPLIHFPTNDASDQFGRNLGVFAKGKLLERLDYRVALNQPFAVPGGTPAEGRADFLPDARTFVAQGYAKWDFLEVESNTLPYMVGTYLGRKRVLNVGAGFHYSPDSMGSLAQGVLQTHDTLLLSVDGFLDVPLGPTGAALTAYAAFSHFDFGPGYLRNVGALNPAQGLVTGAAGSLNGPGNGVPILGTGTLFYLQAGYLLPDVLPGFRLQPYASLGAYRFERLGQAVLLPDVGANLLLGGNHLKLTANYRSRPVFQQVGGGRPVETQRKSEVTLQAQVAF